MKSTRALFAPWCMVAVALMTGACAVVRHPPPAPPRHTNLGLDISSFALSNGLRVVLVKDPHAAQVQVTVRYQVGAVDDLESPGMAHLVEHLMFQQVLGGQSLFATLEDVTTFFNAYTFYDATTYVSRGPRARLDTLLSVEAVRLGFRCTSITEPVFTREREVVINEIRRRGADSEALAALQRAAYPEGHPYGQPIGGNETTIGAISLAEACKFIDAHYAPSSAVLVISGDLTEHDVETSLGKFIARISKRVASAPAHVAAAPVHGRQLDATVPLDDDAVLIAWPMPVDPQIRIKVEAIANAVPAVITNVKGAVRPIALGDARAPMFGVLIEQTDQESAEEVIDHAQQGIASLPQVFRTTMFRRLDQLAFDRLQQTALHDLYASLEDGGERDTRLAAFVLAGRNPREALASEFAGVRELRREEAEQLAVRYFSLGSATIVKLKAIKGKKRGRELVLRPEVHDMGQRRTLVDPAAAHQPAATAPVPSAPGMRTRQLANGMNVVLLPSTSVPTVDMRIVFRTGSADEPAAKRGVALVAAHALEWDMRYLNDMLVFVAAGGTSSVDVTGDHTSFLSRGVDMHIDVLMAGLRRWVREGKYGDNADQAIDELRRQARKRPDEQDQLTKTLMSAMFGANHPYAGSLPSAVTLTAKDAEQFRATHYTPDNATLVIAGRFDPDLADRWIDYLFADWKGRAEPGPSVPRASVQPSSIAKYEDLTQLYLAAALPISVDGHAQQLVTAEVLEEVADTIRQELGASYGVHVELAESRLARMYMLGGWLDASRAKAAVELLRDRVAALRSDPDAAARAFVTARNRVLTRLSTFTGSATGLAARVEHDIDLQRPAMSDLQTAAAVRDLTIEAMTAALADLDLSRALFVMRGPEADVKGAFQVLGRTPSALAFDQAAADDAADDPNAREDVSQRASHDEDNFNTDDIEVALTYQEPKPDSRLLLKLMTTFTWTSVKNENDRFDVDCCDGVAVAAAIGYRIDPERAIGLQVAVGSTHGSYKFDGALMQIPMTFVPIDIAAIGEGSTGRLWGNVSLGLHLDRITVPDDKRAELDQTVTKPSLGAGLNGGIDLVRFGRHRLGVGAHLSAALVSQSGYYALGIGLVYRH